MDFPGAGTADGGLPFVLVQPLTPRAVAPEPDPGPPVGMDDIPDTGERLATLPPAVEPDPEPAPPPSAEPETAPEPAPEPAPAGPPRTATEALLRLATIEGLSPATTVHLPDGLDADLPDESSLTVETTRFGTGATVVRYYHAEDADLARRSAEAVGGEAQDFTSYAPRPSRGTIEVWISRAALSAAGQADAARP